MNKQPILIRTIENARRIEKGQLVAIAFQVQADGSTTAEFANRGILDQVGSDKVSLITLVAGNGHSPIGKGDYFWSESNGYFTTDPGVSEYIEETSPQYRQYAAALGLEEVKV